MSKDHYDMGSWNALCSLCGRKRKGPDLVKNWMGNWRCIEHNEIRQPQDRIRGIAEKPAPPWVQDPQPVTTLVCSIPGSSSIPGYCIPGCIRPGMGCPSALLVEIP